MGAAHVTAPGSVAGRIGAASAPGVLGCFAMTESTTRKHETTGRSEPASPPQPQAVYVLTREQVRSVDRAAIEDYGIPGIVLMENASRALARTALDMLDGRPGRQVLIICGSGNNGGDGWALARHLHNAQMEVVVASLGEPRSPDDAGANCAICRKMGIHEIGPDRLDDYRHAELIVDAIFGTGLDREVHGRAAEIIEWINATGRPVLAVDVPSGLDCDRGRPLGVCVKATRTVSFVGYKPGFTEMSAQPFVGEIEVGEIGVPIELVQRLGTPLPPGPSPSHRRGGTSE